MSPPQQSLQTARARNKADTRRNAMKVEQYLTELEKAQGCAKSWELRERFERGDVTLAGLVRR